MAGKSSLVIDLAALGYNYKKLTSAFGEKVVCILKADAYGHGMERCANTLAGAGARFFAVADVTEGARIRRVLRCFNGVEIFVLGHVSKNEFVSCAKYDLVLPIGSEAAFGAVFNYGQKLKCYLQIDVGMRRYGVSVEDAMAIDRIINKARACGNIRFYGAASHLSAADDEEVFYTERAAFLNAVKKTGVPVSLSASSALEKNAIEGEYKRPGLCLYGYGEVAEKLHLKKPMSLYSVVVGKRPIKAGQAAGYGSVFVADSDRYIGTVPLGYADGIMRGYKGGCVFVNGRAREIVAVCMDSMIIKLGACDKEGDMVAVFSSEGNLNKLTAMAGTIVYEGLTAFCGRKRLKKRFVGC